MHSRALAARIQATSPEFMGLQSKGWLADHCGRVLRSRVFTAHPEVLDKGNPLVGKGLTLVTGLGIGRKDGFPHNHGMKP